LIQDACTALAIADETVKIVNDHDYRRRMVSDLEDVKRQLGGPGASDRAAEAILDVVHSSHAS
jgi:lipid A disaccharide synthetase